MGNQLRQKPRPDLRRSRVIVTVTIPGIGGKNIGPGQLVDLNEHMGNGTRLRDHVEEEWFEAIVHEPASPAPATASQTEE